MSTQMCRHITNPIVSPFMGNLINKNTCRTRFINKKYLLNKYYVLQEVEIIFGII